MALQMKFFTASNGSRIGIIYSESTNTQWDPKTEKRDVQEQYLKFVTSVIELVNPLSQNHPKETLSLIEQIFVGFWEL